LKGARGKAIPEMSLNVPHHRYSKKGWETVGQRGGGEDHRAMFPLKRYQRLPKGSIKQKKGNHGEPRVPPCKLRGWDVGVSPGEKKPRETNWNQNQAQLPGDARAGGLPRTLGLLRI